MLASNTNYVSGKSTHTLLSEVLMLNVQKVMFISWLNDVIILITLLKSSITIVFVTFSLIRKGQIQWPNWHSCSVSPRKWNPSDVW